MNFCRLVFFFSCFFCILYRELLAFTIGHILEKELDEFVDHWNSHKIRKNKWIQGPCGIPNDMYDTPGMFSKSMIKVAHRSLNFHTTIDAHDHAVSVDMNLVCNACISESSHPPSLIDPEVYEIADRILNTRIGIERKHINTENCLNILKF